VTGLVNGEKKYAQISKEDAKKNSSFSDPEVRAELAKKYLLNETKKT